MIYSPGMTGPPLPRALAWLTLLHSPNMTDSAPLDWAWLSDLEHG